MTGVELSRAQQACARTQPVLVATRAGDMMVLSAQAMDAILDEADGARLEPAGSCTNAQGETFHLVALEDWAELLDDIQSVATGLAGPDLLGDFEEI